MLGSKQDCVRSQRTAHTDLTQDFISSSPMVNTVSANVIILTSLRKKCNFQKKKKLVLEELLLLLTEHLA